MNTGEKIKQHRLIKKISPKDLADVLGMDVSNYYRIERDEVRPDIENLLKIADYMQIDLNELLSDDKFVFNFSNNEFTNSGFNGYSVHNYPEELKKLYDDKFSLMQDKIDMLTEERKRLLSEIDTLKERLKG